MLTTRMILQAASLVVLLAVCVPAQAQRFVEWEDGVRDSETELVWGHYLQEVDYYTIGGSFSRDWDGAMSTLVWGGWEDLNGNDLVDPGEAFSSTYEEFSNAHYGVNNTGWRLPTRDELVDAVNAGLTLHFDTSPSPGIQHWAPETNYHSVWSSTRGKKKRGGFDSAYVVSLVDASSHNITVGSTQAAIMVRYDGQPIDEDGGRNGKGRNK